MQFSPLNAQMLRSIALVSTALLLAACSNTPNQVREKPYRLYESNKSVALTEICVLEQYDGFGFPKSLLEITPRTNGGKTIKRFIQRSPDVIFFIADVSPSASGSYTHLYENQTVGGPEKKIMETCGRGAF